MEENKQIKQKNKHPKYHAIIQTEFSINLPDIWYRFVSFTYYPFNIKSVWDLRNPWVFALLNPFRKIHNHFTPHKQ